MENTKSQPISPQSKAPEPPDQVEKLTQWKRTVENAFTAGMLGMEHASLMGGTKLTAHGFITSLRVAMRQAEEEFMGRPGAALSSPSPAPPTFHMYVWTNPSFFHAVAQATSVAEARELLLEEIGSGDGSCPEREHAAKLVRELQPSIFHRSNAEFCLTDSAELREQEAYTKTLQDKIAELMKISPSPATDKEK